MCNVAPDYPRISAESKQSRMVRRLVNRSLRSSNNVFVTARFSTGKIVIEPEFGGEIYQIPIEATGGGDWEFTITKEQAQQIENWELVLTSEGLYIGDVFLSVQPAPEHIQPDYTYQTKLGAESYIQALLEAQPFTSFKNEQLQYIMHRDGNLLASNGDDLIQLRLKELTTDVKVKFALHSKYVSILSWLFPSNVALRVSGNSDFVSFESTWLSVTFPQKPINYPKTSHVTDGRLEQNYMFFERPSFSEAISKCLVELDRQLSAKYDSEFVKSDFKHRSVLQFHYIEEGKYYAQFDSCVDTGEIVCSGKHVGKLPSLFSLEYRYIESFLKAIEPYSFVKVAFGLNNKLMFITSGGLKVAFPTRKGV